MELEKSCRNSRIKKGMQDQLLAALYGHVWGRLLLWPLIRPGFSRLGGKLLNSRASAILVKPFVKINGIDLSECEKQKFDSYNDFFTRKLTAPARPISEDGFIAPCDARLSVYPIEREGRFRIKNTEYTVKSLLRNERLAERFEGGNLWLYRLCVDDYHRYIHPADGRKSKNVRIPGVFHTVNPVANDVYPIYKENTREYCLLKTSEYGTVLVMEVGAMLVGKIENEDRNSAIVRRGEEKGHFAFGGSTILVMTQKEAVDPAEMYLENTKCGIETKVKMGQIVSA